MGVVDRVFLKRYCSKDLDEVREVILRMGGVSVLRIIKVEAVLENWRNNKEASMVGVKWM